MFHLFHGENVDASRKELQAWREKYVEREVIILSGKSNSFTDLVQAAESGSLFQKDKLVLAENFFASKKIEAKALLTWLKRLPTTTEIIFWEEKELSKTLLNLFPKTTDIALFRFEKSVFSFLESLRPGITSDLVANFDYCLQTAPSELVFSLLVRQLRYLIMVKDATASIDLSPWQLGKFRRQAEIFTLTQLLTLYRKLLQIDVKIKTGQTPFTLAEEIRLFLVKI